MDTDAKSRQPRVAGALLGACLAVTLIVLALPSGGRGGVLPASLDVSVQSSGTIAAEPADPSVVLHTTDLRPSGPTATGSFDLVNQTGAAVTVGLRALASSTELDSLATIRIEANGELLAAAPIGELREGTPGAVVLGSGERRQLRVSAEIPADAGSGYEGRYVDLKLIPAIRGADR